MIGLINITVHRVVRIPGKLLQLTAFNRPQLRTIQLAHQRSQRSSQRIQWSQQNIWLGLGRKLEHKTAKIVAFQKRCGVEDAAGQVVNVHAGEGVDFASVTADVDEFGVEEAGGDDIGEEVGYFVGVGLWAAVLM